MQESEEEVHQGPRTRPSWIKLVYLFNPVFLDRAIDDTASHWYHEVFVSRTNQHVQFALLVRLIQVTRNLAALKTVRVVHDMIDVVPLAYLGHIHYFIRRSWRETTRRGEDAENFVTANALNSSFDLLHVSDERFAIDEGLNH